MLWAGEICGRSSLTSCPGAAQLQSQVVLCSHTSIPCHHSRLWLMPWGAFFTLDLQVALQNCSLVSLC